MRSAFIMLICTLLFGCSALDATTAGAGGEMDASQLRPASSSTEPVVVFERSFHLDEQQAYIWDLRPGTYRVQIKSADPVNLRAYASRQEFDDRFKRATTGYTTCDLDQVFGVEETCSFSEGAILAVEPYSSSYGANLYVKITT